MWVILVIVVGFIILDYRMRREISTGFRNAIAVVLLTRSVRTDIDETILTIVKGWKQTHPWMTQGDEQIMRRLQELGMFATTIDGEVEANIRAGVSGNTRVVDNISPTEQRAINRIWEETTKDERPPARRDCVPPPKEE